MEEEKQNNGNDPETPDVGEAMNGAATENKEHPGEEKPEKKEKEHKSRHKKDEKTARLEEDLALLNDKYVRLYSEFDNYRKRTIREKAELGKTAASDVLTALLPVLDDFERAIKAFEISVDSQDPLKHGLVLIYNKFMSILAQQGLEQMKTIGTAFDTDLHEAVANIAAGDAAQKGVVLDEVEKGYLLNGKVLRFAKVVVGN